jgi:CheY-like chemotaxis protein
MSHEIRTPMNAIVGFTDLLLTSNFSPQDQEYLNTIKYSADNLMVILNDILDFSKIEAGKFLLENFEFDLKEKLGYLERTFEVAAKRKNIELSFQIDEKVPNELMGDPHRLNQILVNLLGNSLKFTSAGFVRLTVGVVKDYRDSVDLKISVSDSGIGIPEDKLSLIFDSFSQAHQNNATKYFGGTGLGLTITRKITDLMRGSISAQSQLGVGSTFSVYLNFLKNPKPAKISAVSPKSGLSLKGYRILVAEDIMANQILLKHLLQRWGADFVICNNGQEALEFLEKQAFDIILMDLQMPVMDGVAAMRSIRRSFPQFSDVPVIALTADTFAETVAEIASCNFSDFVTKPFKADELVKKIHMHLGIESVS